MEDACSAEAADDEDMDDDANRCGLRATAAGRTTRGSGTVRSAKLNCDDEAATATRLTSVADAGKRISTFFESVRGTHERAPSQKMVASAVSVPRTSTLTITM